METGKCGDGVVPGEDEELCIRQCDGVCDPSRPVPRWQVTGTVGPIVLDAVPCHAFLPDAPSCDSTWRPPQDWGTRLQGLALADSAVDSFKELQGRLLDLAQELDELPPLEAKLRERQIRAILRVKRIRAGAGLIRAAKIEHRQRKTKQGVEHETDRT